MLYQEHVHPFLEKNEIAIDDFISSAHDRAKAAGATYLKHGIELIKQYVFGLPPKEPTPPPTPTPFSYTQSLIARFNLPSARPAFPANPIAGATSTANDFYTLLASAVTAATSSTTGTGKARDLSNSGILIPPTVDGQDRLSFIAAQRDRLAILLSALDKEVSTLQGKPASPSQRSLLYDGAGDEDSADRSKSATSGLSSRKSEADFEKIDAESGTEDVESERRRVKRSQSTGSWMPWSWGVKAAAPVDTLMSGTGDEGVHGKSSGVDT